MNRIEELELTVQMLCDNITGTVTFQGEAEACEKLERLKDEAENILLGLPCNCTQFPFPHKRTRECFRRYNGQTS